MFNRFRALAEAYNDNTRFIDVQHINYGNTMLLDNKGRVWSIGYQNGNNSDQAKEFALINTFVENNVTITKLAKMRSTNSTCSYAAIDSEGKVWTWGNDSYTSGLNSTSYTPICISDSDENYPLHDVKIVDIAITSNTAMALDDNGDLWMWGNTLLGNTTNTPTKISSALFAGAKIKVISVAQGRAGVIDEEGRVWTWGYNLGDGTTSGSTTPRCISLNPNGKLYGLEIKDIEISENTSSHTIVVDTNNNLWAWNVQGKSYYGEAGDYISTGYVVNPQIIDYSYDEHLEYNLKFTKVFMGHYTESSATYYAIDDEGRVWGWGYNNYNVLGKMEGQIGSGRNVATPTVIEIPGNPKIVKVSLCYYNAIMLSEDGRVYVCGYKGYTGENYTGQDYIGVTEITNNFNLPEGAVITDVYGLSNYNYAAIDSQGNLYTWGDSYYYGRTGNPYLIDKVVFYDNAGGIIGNVKAKKLSYSDTGNFGVISEDGDLYGWNGGQRPTLRNSGNNFVDIQGTYLLDSEGRLWKGDYTSSTGNNTKCLFDDYSTTFYQKKQVDSNYKILKLYDCDSSNMGIFRDSNGELLKYDGSTLTKLNLGVDEFISIDSSTSSTRMEGILLDKYGQIWKFDENGTVCLSDTVSKNPLYNKKIVRLRSNSYVEDENGVIYEISNFGITEKDFLSQVHYVESKFNTKIIDIVGSPSDWGYVRSRCMMIDENGKLWAWYNDTNENAKTVKCLSEVPNSELARKIEANSNFKLVKLYGDNNNSFYALDNSGKVWVWGNGKAGTSSSEDLYSPTCISDLPDVDMTNVTYLSGNSTNVVAKDDNGNVWVWGTQNGQFGNGTSTEIIKPYHINTECLDGKKIKTIKFVSNQGILLCDDGSVYISGDTDLNTSMKWTLLEQNIENVKDIYITSNYDNTNGKNRATYFIVGENKYWSLGYNGKVRRYCLTSDQTTDYFSTVQLLSDQFTVKEVMNNYNGSIIDTNGKYWYFDYATQQFVCCEHEERFVGCSEYYIVDTTGNVYYAYRGLSRNEGNISEVVEEVYGELNEENIMKWIEIAQKAGNASYYYICVNGKVYELVRNTGYVPFVNYRCLNNVAGSEMNGKNIVEILASSDKGLALDSEGNLYAWGTTGFKNCSVPYVCVTSRKDLVENPIKTRNTILNSPESNELYGVKFKQLINDKFAIDEDDNIWYFTVSGKATNLTKEYQGYENPIAGKEVTKVINKDYIVTNDNKIWYVGKDYPTYVLDAPTTDFEIIYWSDSVGYESYVALDANGKIWVAGVDLNNLGFLGLDTQRNTNKQAICLNNVEGTDLFAASQTEGFKIVKMIYNWGTIIAIDNSGKVWTWGSGAVNYTNSVEATTPKCITDMDGTALYDAYRLQTPLIIKDIKTDAGVYLVDNEDNLWIIKDKDTNNNEFKNIRDIATGDLGADLRANNELKVRYATDKCFFIGNDGSLYASNTREGAAYRQANRPYYRKIGLSNVKDIVYVYYDTSYKYYRDYALLENSSTYYLVSESNQGTISIYTSAVNQTVKKIVGVSNYQLILDNDGKLWAQGQYDLYENDTRYGIAVSGVTNGTKVCLSDMQDYAFYGKTVKDIEFIGTNYHDQTFIATDSEDNLYIWGNMVQSKRPLKFDMFDEQVMEVYGVVNNDTRKQFIRLVHDSLEIKNEWLSTLYNSRKLETLVEVEGRGIYRIKITSVVRNESVAIECSRVSYSDSYLGGMGELTEVVGENEVKTSTGIIYRLIPTGVDTFATSITDTPTEFVTDHSTEPITIEGANIIKQTPHKALDDKGNLYVWDTYTGLGKDTDGVVSINEEQYSVEPIYSNTNGWMVITKTH